MFWYNSFYGNTKRPYQNRVLLTFLHRLLTQICRPCLKMGHKTSAGVGQLQSYTVCRILVLKNLKYYGSEYKASVPIVES